MASSEEFNNSWQRLSDHDLAAINVLFCNEKLRQLSPELVAYLGGRLAVQVRHQQELSTIPDHSLPWKCVDNPALSRMFKAANAVERGCCHTSTLYEWASLLLSSVTWEMCSRLETTAASRADQN